MIQVGMIYPWEEKERLGQYVSVRYPSSVTHQFIPCLRTSQVKFIFGSNWLIQFIMPEVKLSIRVFYLGLLQYLIYLELRFPEGKKKVQILMYKVLDFIYLLIFSALDQTRAFRHSRKVLYHWATPSVQEFELW